MAQESNSCCGIEPLESTGILIVVAAYAKASNCERMHVILASGMSPSQVPLAAACSKSHWMRAGDVVPTSQYFQYEILSEVNPTIVALTPRHHTLQVLQVEQWQHCVWPWEHTGSAVFGKCSTRSCEKSSAKATTTYDRQLLHRVERFLPEEVCNVAVMAYDNTRFGIQLCRCGCVVVGERHALTFVVQTNHTCANAVKQQAH